MAIPKLLEDLAIISKLGDTPGNDDGLSTKALKEKFDEGVLKIQTYINDTLIDHLNELVDVQALLSGILDSTLTLANKAAQASAVGAAIKKLTDDKLGTAGGTVSGILDMNGNTVTGLREPVLSSDSVPKSYVDAKHFVINVTIGTEWEGETAPFTQTVTAPGLEESDAPHVCPVYDSSIEVRATQREAWALVSDIDSGSGIVVFTCDEEKPSAEIPIQIEVNR